MTQSATPFDPSIQEFRPKLPVFSELAAGATAPPRDQPIAVLSIGRQRQTLELTYGGLTTRAQQAIESDPVETELDGYHQTLQALHARRRELLRLKRIGSSDYSEEEFGDLRRYIDDFQNVLVRREAEKFASVMGRVEAVTNQLLAGLRR